MRTTSAISAPRRRRDARGRSGDRADARRRAGSACSAGDRRASLSEIRKLALYAKGESNVTLADVLAVVADASALALDDVADAARGTRRPTVETLSQGAQCRHGAGRPWCRRRCARWRSFTAPA